VDFDEAEVLGALAADTRTSDDGGALAEVGSPFDAGGGYGFARGDDGELGEAVDEVGPAVVEVRLMAVSAHLGAVLETDLRHVRGLDGADAAAPLTQSLGERRDVASERRDGAEAGDGDAAHLLVRRGRFGRHELRHTLAPLPHVAHGAHLVVRDADVELIL